MGRETGTETKKTSQGGLFLIGALQNPFGLHSALPRFAQVIPGAHPAGQRRELRCSACAPGARWSNPDSGRRSNHFLENHINKKVRHEAGPFCLYGVPKGIRTPVVAVKGRCPRPTRRWGPGRFGVGLGGARRDRTADLLHAMQALSQLSYSPGSGIRPLNTRVKTIKIQARQRRRTLRSDVVQVKHKPVK